MQRRAAASFAAFFLVLALGSYGMIATASAPPVSVDNPDHRLGDGGQVTVDGRTYTASVSEGRATLAWTNESATHTAEWQNGSDVTLQGTNFSVTTRAQASPTQVQLTEVQSLGPNVTTTTVNDTEYVVLDDGENRTLVPKARYLRGTQGEPETRSIAQGDAVDYRGNQTTLASVTNESATLQWTAPREETVDAAEGDVVELEGNEFVAHFPDPGTLVLDGDVQAYQHQLEVQSTYHERINGLWGVSILSGLAVVLLLGMAYLPSRY